METVIKLNWFPVSINLCAHKFNLNLMKKSFTYMSVQLWNGLPVSVKLASNVNLFKNLLRTLKL